MRTPLTIFFAAAALTLFTAAADAQLTNSTTAAGRASVIDPTNQLEWLHLEQTYNLTPNAAVAAFADEGFRWATLPELNGLLTSFYDDFYGDFFTNNPAEDPADYRLFAANESEVFLSPTRLPENTTGDLYGAFRDLFGLAVFVGTGNSGGYYDDGVDDLSQDYWTTSNDSASSFLITGFNALTDLSQNGNVTGDTTDGGENFYGEQLGVFLVRNVPEPTTLALITLGTLTLATRRSQRPRFVSQPIDTQ